MMASFWLQGTTAGWDPAGFHLVNILLHACAAWALYLVARALGCGCVAALFGGLLFAVYPPNHEPVAWIVGRSDILATLFYLFGWRAVLGWEGGGADGIGAPGAGLAGARDLGRSGTLAVGAGVFSLGLLAMFGKENAVTCVLLVPLTMLFARAARRPAAGTSPPGGKERERDRTRALVCVAVLLAFAVYLGLRAVAIGGLAPQPHEFTAGMNPVARLPQPQRTLAALYLTGRLLLALIWPARLTASLDFGPHHPFPLAGFLDPRVVLTAAALAAMLVLTVALWRRRSLLTLPVILVLLNLLPISNLVVVTAGFISERFLYLPSAGLALGGALVWQATAGRLAARPGVARAAAAAALALVVGCSGLAMARVEEWRDDESIYRAWSRRFPLTPVFLNGLGIAAAQQQHLDAARDAFTRSLALDPDNPRVHYYLGSVLAQLGQPADAARALARAAELQPDDPENRVALAEALLDLGQAEAALAQARAASAFVPGDAATRELLARALAANGLYPEAARQYRALLQDDPRNLTSRNALLLCLYRDGQWEAARTEAEAGGRLLPQVALFDLWQARLAARAGRMDEAHRRLDEAKRKTGPIAAWLREVGDDAALREDPGARLPSQAN